MNFRREDGNVTFTLKQDDFDLLMIAIGVAAGSAAREGDKSMFRSGFRLANAINEGNPDYVPYELSDPEPGGAQT